MNLLLWIIQILLAGLYAVAGITKIFMFETFAQQVASAKALPKGMWIVIAVFELLCSAGLVLPAATKLQWPLTAIAASGLAVEGLLIGVLHGVHGEHSPMIFTIALAALAAFVAYGRSAIK
jgi:uncharacterized membrane protein YphA (DoxX/SURF4 family)